MKTAYLRVPRVGEVFIEFPAIEQGRMWFDVLWMEDSVGVFVGRCHLVLSSDKKGFPWWAMLGALSVPSIFGFSWGAPATP